MPSLTAGLVALWEGIIGSPPRCFYCAIPFARATDSCLPHTFDNVDAMICNLILRQNCVSAADGSLVFS